MSLLSRVYLIYLDVPNKNFHILIVTKGSVLRKSLKLLLSMSKCLFKCLFIIQAWNKKLIHLKRILSELLNTIC